jgi:putative colanic acid biosynthesis acetyltransferase WcaF
MKPWELKVGDWVAIGDRVELYNFCEIEIGAMAVISQDCYLCTGTHDYTDPTMPLICRPILIEPESWTAAGVFIGPGVTIGRGAVIGARSVVVKDVKAWTVAAGNPCRDIKPRTLRGTS